MKRLKILVSCYACGPGRGSEPGMGWQFVQAISKRHDLWVITEQEKWQSEIEAEMERRPELREHLHFHYIAKKRRRTLRKIWPPSYYWYYRIWQKNAYRLASELCEEVSFDIVHQLNMVGFREPGYLWKLDLPFVWGPIGGMAQFPWRFLRCLGPAGATYHAARNIINQLHMSFLSRPKQAARKANRGLIAATSETQKKARLLWGVDATVLCELGRAEGISEAISNRKENSPLRLAWSGLHISRKGLPLFLKALALVDERVDWKLDILGEGVQSVAWKKLARALGIDSRCCWRGWMPRDESFSITGAAHLFVITSLMDLTSSVTLEALSQGLPVICLDHCGFADVIDSACGVAIPVTTPKRISQDIAGTIEMLWDDEGHRRRLAAAAFRRSHDFSWERRIDILDGIYDSVLSAAKTQNLNG